MTPDSSDHRTAPRTTSIRANLPGPRRWFQPGWLVLAAAILCAVVLGPRAIRWLPDLNQRQEFQLQTSSIQIRDVPQWIPADFLAQVLEQGRIAPVRSILDEKLITDLAKAFKRHPWVEKVVRISKGMPPRVDVELVFRRPAAMVQVATGWLPVDSNGVLLPPTDFSPADTQRYPLILQSGSNPKGGPGQSWGDPLIVGAAKLAAVLLPDWKDFGLDAILVPAAATNAQQPWDGNYQLLTRGHSRILWGRAPGVVYPGELTADQKLGRLEECVTRFGGFDQPDGPYEIDIRHFQEITRVRLTAEQIIPRRRN